jgi:hypothetical protein
MKLKSTSTAKTITMLEVRHYKSVPDSSVGSHLALRLEPLKRIILTVS